MSDAHREGSLKNLDDAKRLESIAASLTAAGGRAGRRAEGRQVTSFNGMPIVVVYPETIKVKRTWRERLRHPFSRYKMVTLPSHIAPNKYYIINDVLYCGPEVYHKLINQVNNHDTQSSPKTP